MSQGAIVFLLNRSFLPGLKMFAYSARRAFAAAREDVVILTDDPVVTNDPFARAFADRIIFIGDEERQSFRSINVDRVDETYRTETVGAYWFLKFYMFRDLGYEYHIFVDADLLCVSSRFRFADIPTDADFVAAPTVGPRALGLDSWSHRPDEVEVAQFLKRIKKIAKNNYKISRKLNSGVVRIGKNLIGDHHVAGLIDLASNQSFRMAQEVVRAYVERQSATFKVLPIWWNFPVLPAAVIGPKNFASLKEVRILHYNRPAKPWSDGSRGDWMDQLWLSHATASSNWKRWLPWRRRFRKAKSALLLDARL